MKSADWYRARIAEWTGRRDARAARGVILSRFRLASFLGGVALSGGASPQPAERDRRRRRRHSSPSPCSWSSMRECSTRVERAGAARRLGEHGLARLARDWSALPEVQPPADLDGIRIRTRAISISTDTGRSPSGWDPGARRTARGGWPDGCSAPSNGEDLPSRQAAVDELAQKREWRETLDTEGALLHIAPGELESFLQWAEIIGFRGPAGDARDCPGR